jgi:hypothetical protein
MNPNRNGVINGVPRDFANTEFVNHVELMGEIAKFRHQALHKSESWLRFNLQHGLQAYISYAKPEGAISPLFVKLFDTLMGNEIQSDNVTHYLIGSVYLTITKGGE